MDMLAIALSTTQTAPDAATPAAGVGDAFARCLAREVQQAIKPGATPVKPMTAVKTACALGPGASRSDANEVVSDANASSGHSATGDEGTANAGAEAGLATTDSTLAAQEAVLGMVVASNFAVLPWQLAGLAVPASPGVADDPTGVAGTSVSGVVASVASMPVQTESTQGSQSGQVAALSFDAARNASTSDAAALPNQVPAVTIPGQPRSAPNGREAALGVPQGANVGESVPARGADDVSALGLGAPSGGLSVQAPAAPVAVLADAALRNGPVVSAVSGPIAGVTPGLGGDASGRGLGATLGQVGLGVREDGAQGSSTGRDAVGVSRMIEGVAAVSGSAQGVLETALTELDGVGDPRLAFDARAVMADARVVGAPKALPGAGANALVAPSASWLMADLGLLGAGIGETIAPPDGVDGLLMPPGDTLGSGEAVYTDEPVTAMAPGLDGRGLTGGVASRGAQGLGSDLGLVKPQTGVEAGVSDGLGVPVVNGVAPRPSALNQVVAGAGDRLEVLEAGLALNQVQPEASAISAATERVPGVQRAEAAQGVLSSGFVAATVVNNGVADRSAGLRRVAPVENGPDRVAGESVLNGEAVAPAGDGRFAGSGGPTGRDADGGEAGTAGQGGRGFDSTQWLGAGAARLGPAVGGMAIGGGTQVPAEAGLAVAAEDEAVVAEVIQPSEPVSDKVAGALGGLGASERVLPSVREAGETTPAQRVMPQVFEALTQLRGGMVRSLRVALNPEELGPLEIQVVSRGGVLHARLSAESQEVKSVLDTQVASLQRHLQELGLKVERVDVVWQGSESMRQGAGEASAQGQFGQGQFEGGQARQNARGAGAVTLAEPVSEVLRLADEGTGGAVDYRA
jgi:hypothetical protein